jgi:hypothetical protein
VIERSSDRADERAKRSRQRHELDFGSRFLGVVVERRAYAVEAEIADAEFVVLILDRAGPKADDVDRGGLRPKFAFAGVFDLLQRDAPVVRRAFHGGNMVERAEAGDRCAHIAAVEQVRAADRLSFRVKR